jgi:two-component system chemotaxis response regulator CheB
MLTRALSLDPRIEVVGIGRSGVEAIERARELKPDVITLDIEMPELSGLEALPHLRRHSEARVVVLSNADDPDTTYLALALGAVDFIPKPSGGFAASLTELSEVLLKKIKTAYRIDPNSVLAASKIAAWQTAPEGGVPPLVSDISACVAIAASTGGPPALEKLFSGLSGSQPAAYVVVQHLPQGFSESLTRRLCSAGSVEVIQAFDGVRLKPGHGYVAPWGYHIRVAQDAAGAILRFDDAPPIHGVRPAADPLFESTAQFFGRNAVGVVMTGMGSDGSHGSAEIATAGGRIIVQDETTSVVWGMPSAVLRAGVPATVTVLDNIAAEVRRQVRQRGEVA